MFLEALKKWFVHLSSKNDFFCKKAQTHENLSSALQKKLFISLERNIFHVHEALLLKLHLATFSHWERCFWASVASHSHNLLICTKTQIGVLRSSKEWFVHLSSKMTFSAKKLKHMKICLLHCKKLFISLERNIFHVHWSFALKIAFSNFFSLRKMFWASVASHSHNLLICTKTQNWCS